ncbi:SnoaL-like protein [Kribbella orskensis]|uniref:SnoaL-like protein n=1 Tax=Kribbella orskensis TaxID=2512216 RepID=A0ABY2BZ42_9ACTN|nr:MULTISPECIES: nuclear transport factor 2 family protein [Kribbella]TCN44164.1 SnoaL-like protein [Kribbella sp. VKM Ac-2500]TCO32058.1 SnoaL-like protein [Kribbella orskensis]
MPDFVNRWATFWSQPTPEAVRELTHPDIVLRWPGQAAPITGADAWAARVAGTIARFPDLRLEVTGHAQEGETLFISWRGFATVNDEPAEWEGIDRMTIRDGVVVDSLVAFDTTALRAP